MATIEREVMLSESERNLLERDADLLKKVVRYGSFILPVLFFLSVVSWMYDWYGLFKFLFPVLSFFGTIALAGSFAQSFRLSADIRSNVKTIERFIIDKKIVEGYARSLRSDGGGINDQKVLRKITISDAKVQEALNYKIEKQKNTKDPFNGPLFSDLDPYYEVLRYKYNFKVRQDQENKTTNFIIPIEYYLVAQEGETIDISYGKRSKKVFKVINAFQS